MVILSIDLGKAKSLFCWYQTSDQSHEFATVASTPATFHEAITSGPVDRVVIEVCDMAGWVKDLCQTLSIPIQVANANVEGWRWKHVKNKTDKKDALKLARLSVANDLKLVHLPDRQTRHWRSLILYRHKLIERRTAIKNSIHALMVSEGRAMRGGRQWKDELLGELRKLARPMGQCNAQELWAGHLWMELQSLGHLMEQIERLDQKLNALGKADPRVIRLKTIPGVGPRLSELVVAVLDDPHRFKNARQVSAYAGLVPKQYQSGQMNRLGRITGQGPGLLRRVLVQSAWGLARREGTRGKEVFERLCHGQRTRRKQAAVALARKILIWCWAILRDDGGVWDESRAG